MDFTKYGALAIKAMIRKAQSGQSERPKSTLMSLFCCRRRRAFLLKCTARKIRDVAIIMFRFIVSQP
jgi:hypothetical protein